jgi:hypothetical protein
MGGGFEGRLIFGLTRYLENARLEAKYLSRSSVQLLYEIFLSTINIQRITLDVTPKIRPRSQVRFPSSSSAFNPNWKIAD